MIRVGGIYNDTAPRSCWNIHNIRLVCVLFNYHKTCPMLLLSASKRPESVLFGRYFTILKFISANREGPDSFRYRPSYNGELI